MSILQPFMLWCALAIAIPVFIHFWHQKKGKELDWAAMQWLIDKSQQQSRGFRLDDLPLLLVRCLLVLLLAFMLSQPVFKNITKQNNSERIHLVEPSAYLVNNFRFELETAIKNGEKVYWINPGAVEVKNLASISEQKNNRLLYVQDIINQVEKPGVKLDLYFLNDVKLSDLPRIYIPDAFTLHTAIDSSENDVHNYLDAGDGNKLYVEKGRLTVYKNGKSGDVPRLANAPTHTGGLTVLIDYENKAEQQTVEAALSSLSSFYSWPVRVDLKNKPDTKYDLVLTDKKVEAIKPEILYVLSGSKAADGQVLAPNVVQLQDSLRIQTSELVRSGQLPEYLGDLLVKHFKLEEKKGYLSQSQLKAIFEKTEPRTLEEKGNIRPWLLILFIGLIILERWMALKKTIQKRYV